MARQQRLAEVTVAIRSNDDGGVMKSAQSLVREQPTSLGEWRERGRTLAHTRLTIDFEAWNRAPLTVREDFAEMVKDSHLGVI